MAVSNDARNKSVLVRLSVRLSACLCLSHVSTPTTQTDSPWAEPDVANVYASARLHDGRTHLFYSCPALEYWR